MDDLVVNPHAIDRFLERTGLDIPGADADAMIRKCVRDGYDFGVQTGKSRMIRHGVNGSDYVFVCSPTSEGWKVFTVMDVNMAMGNIEANGHHRRMTTRRKRNIVRKRRRHA